MTTESSKEVKGKLVVVVSIFKDSRGFEYEFHSPSGTAVGWAATQKDVVKQVSRKLAAIDTKRVFRSDLDEALLDAFRGYPTKE